MSKCHNRVHIKFISLFFKYHILNKILVLIVYMDDIIILEMIQWKCIKLEIMVYTELCTSEFEIMH